RNFPSLAHFPGKTSRSRRPMRKEAAARSALFERIIERGRRTAGKEASMKVGDVSRRRRLADPVRLRWYAKYRALRFARRMLRAQLEAATPASCESAGQSA